MLRGPDHQINKRPSGAATLIGRIFHPPKKKFHKTKVFKNFHPLVRILGDPRVGVSSSLAHSTCLHLSLSAAVHIVTTMATLCYCG